MDSGFTIQSVLNKTIDVYIYYWLLQNNERIYQCGRATAQMNMDMDTFLNLEIPLPSLAEQQTLQSDFDEIRHKHAKIAEYKAKAQEAISRLIPNSNPKIADQEPEIVIEIEEDIPIACCQAKLKGKGGELCGKPSIGDTGRCKGHKPKSPSSD